MSTPKTNEPQRIAKLLARAGVASRRDVERLIEARRVALDGVPIETPATLLTSLRGITVDGEPVQAAAPTRLFRYHKPAGVLTAARDPHGRQTIYDRMPADLPRLMPVGRLDLNTEGLLLLTTDGELKRQLELPATGVERTYRARAYGEVSQAQLEDLMLGVEIEGVRYGPINANMERRTGTNVWVEMTLTEGKNREVRRVLEYLGLQVSRLIRTRYGPFYLEDMPIASVDEIRQHDLVAFRKTLKDRPTSKPTPEGADPAALKQWRREPSRDHATQRPRPAPVPYGERVARDVQPHPQAFRRSRPVAEETREAPRGTGFGNRPAGTSPRRKDGLAGRRDESGAPRSPREQRAAAFADRTGRKPAGERAERPAAAGRDGKPRGTLSASFGGERPPRDDRRPARGDRPDRSERPQRADAPRTGTPRGEARQFPRSEGPSGPRSDGPRSPRSEGPRSARGENPRAGGYGAASPRGEGARGPRGDAPRSGGGYGAPRSDGPRMPQGDGPRSSRGEGPRTPRGDGPRTPRGDGPRTPRSDAPRSPRGDGPARPPRGGRPGGPPKGRR